MPAKPAPWGHHPPLDGLRAIAALLVVLFHAGASSLAGGFVGVDVFFVLSGFLITAILVREGANIRIRYGRFFARRFRRLLPAASVVLVITAIACRLSDAMGPMEYLRLRPGFIAAALYHSNWSFLIESQDYFAADHQGTSPVLHYWSLSVEEQFYLVWPFLMAGVVALYRRSVNLALGAVVFLALVSLGLSIHAGLEDPMVSYFGTHTRAWQPLAGAAVALATLNPQRRNLGWLSGVGLIGVLLASLTVVPLDEPLARGVLTVVAMVVLLISLEAAPDSRVARLLSWAPLRRLGDWSYSIYLWHWPVVVLLDAGHLLPEEGALRIAAVVVITVVLSALTYQFVERPTRRMSVDGREWKVVKLGILGAGVTAAAMVAILPVDPETRELAEKIEAGPAWQEGRLVGTGPHVAVIGDSHADQLRGAFLELAYPNQWSMTLEVKLACPWIGGTWIYEDRVTDCTYPDVDADLVVLASRSLALRPIVERGETFELGTPQWREAVERRTRAALQRRLDQADRVVLIELIPEMEAAPADCLARREADCSSPAVYLPEAAFVRELYRELAAEDARVDAWDLSELLCPDGRCPAVSGGIVTRRDEHHLAMDYAQSLAPELGERLPPGLVLYEKH
ncbi:MAG: acyltransferase [Proteobacteria bacterium]|nr:acyltransferase [Pseudomonadota bacterium]MCP4921766.1 acyltransferase [Pseudomonadota bacterium]